MTDLEASAASKMVSANYLFRQILVGFLTAGVMVTDAADVQATETKR